MATHHRVDRVREQLLRELSDIIGRLQDPRVHLVTVVDTAVSRDLRQASMYVSLIGTPEQQRQAVEGLNHALGYIRREVGQRIQLRHVPELRVIYDRTPEQASHLSALIDRAISLENPDRAAAVGEAEGPAVQRPPGQGLRAADEVEGDLEDEDDEAEGDLEDEGDEAGDDDLDEAEGDLEDEDDEAGDDDLDEAEADLKDDGLDETGTSRAGGRAPR